MAAELKDLIGKVLKSVTASEDELIFTLEDGKQYWLYHSQDCCESVTIESIVGDLTDLIGEPILVAEKVNGETPAGYKFEYEPESYTWTFYKFATRKGYVDVRWFGESNGYYSESVDFDEKR